MSGTIADVVSTQGLTSLSNLVGCLHSPLIWGGFGLFWGKLEWVQAVTLAQQGLFGWLAHTQPCSVRGPLSCPHAALLCEGSLALPTWYLSGLSNPVSTHWSLHQ